MNIATLLTAIRTEIGDKEEPYRYDEMALLEFIQGAISDYSQYRPRRKRGSITLREDSLEYQMPDDYQVWVSGLENYEVLDSMLYLDVYPRSPIILTFVYLANHDVSSLPESSLSLIVDYCMWKLLSDATREGSEISELKLGKGLDIKFDNFDQISKLAETRYSSYLSAVKKTIGGGT
ncbi:hypothetical protein [Paenibacillus rigui]|uniref:Uncharacterized protein n=1 Tax=Paenibacillus rigui TaxID=554312 RepID=A0A229UMK4_9BACL|nr:hypothetical protein [Paenibacillus rigui]OXM84602.1 hypothetical protein CF651_19030 [Paenibacillus rigui]